MVARFWVRKKGRRLPPIIATAIARLGGDWCRSDGNTEVGMKGIPASRHTCTQHGWNERKMQRAAIKNSSVDTWHSRGWHSRPYQNALWTCSQREREKKRVFSGIYLSAFFASFFTHFMYRTYHCTIHSTTGCVVKQIEIDFFFLLLQLVFKKRPLCKILPPNATIHKSLHWENIKVKAVVLMCEWVEPDNGPVRFVLKPLFNDHPITLGHISYRYTVHSVAI